MAASTLAWALAAVLSLAGAAWGDQIGPNDHIPDYLAKYGIEVQEHSIITDDGYVLMAFRLPNEGKPVVLMQHGVLSSAWCWIDNEPSLAPAMQIHKMGYDVWLTNSRGNMFSRKHTTMKPFLDKAFWDFSFSEMGRHDVPSNIRYILRETGKANLTFVAHSQGTSQFFATMTDPATRSFVESKVNLFAALSPVTYLKHQRGLLLNAVSLFGLGALFEKKFPYGFLDVNTLPTVANLLCKVTNGLICSIGVDTVCGSSDLDTPGAITNISAHFPAGTSVKCLEHYEQLINSGKFQDFDYGEDGNMQRYKTKTPPQYDLSSAKVPTALFIGTQDFLGDPTDEERAASELPKSTVVFKEEFADYSHITWIAGNAASFGNWYPKLAKLLQQYNPVGASQSRPNGALGQILV